MSNSPATRRALLAGASAAAVAVTGLVAAPGASAQVGTFSQQTPITIGAATRATPYPSNIEVAGMPRGISDVNVTLTSWDHSQPEEMDVLLVAPSGAIVTLISDVGGSSTLSGRNITLDDQAPNTLPDAATPTSGTYRPTDIVPGDEYPDLPPAASTAPTSLATFNGSNPNGTWHLYVSNADENMVDDTGDIDSWSLQVMTVDMPAAPVISSPTNGLDTNGDFILAGTAQAGSTVKVFEGTTLLAQTTATTTGTWALVLLDQEPRVHAYTATATDAFGNVSAVSSVKTVAVDVVHPRVIRTKPEAAADNVRRGRNVRAFFSEPVRSRSIVGANVKLVRVATGATVRARIGYDADTRSVIIDPRKDLAENARYKVVIGTGVKDLAGNRLDQNTARSGNQAKVWRFTTR